jgi:hypothetical protein
MVKYRISNWRLLTGSFLGFMGSFIIVCDKFPPIHHTIDKFWEWKDVNLGIKALSTLDQRQSDNQLIGYVRNGDPGFLHFVAIIKDNRPDLCDSTIVLIAMNAPISVGGLESKNVHVKFLDNMQTLPLTSEFIFRDWIARDRERFFLRIGLIFVALAFFLGIIGRVQKN